MKYFIAFFGALLACSDSPPRLGPGPSEGGADSAFAPTVGDDDSGAEVQRKITIVLAAPDLPPQYVCLAGFQPDANGMPQGDPVHARGPFGVFDHTDPAHLALKSGFPYGAVVPLPVRQRDADFFDHLAAVGYLVDDVQPRQFAGFGVDSDACKNAYATAQNFPWRILAFKKGGLAVGQSWVAALTGCQSASSAPECAGGSNIKLVSSPLDTSPPALFSGAGEVRVGFQFVNLSPWGGYQNIDVYVQAMRSGALVETGGAGDAGVPSIADGLPVLIGDGSKGLGWGDVTSRTSGVQMPGADTAAAVLLVVPHGQTPCAGNAACATSTILLPIDPFVARYAAPTGGATGAAWSGNQVLALFGRIPLSADEAPSTVVRLGVLSASIP